MKLILTAGYDRAPHVAAMLHLLTRRGHEIVGLVVVSAFQWKRFRAMVRQRGAGAMLGLIKRALGAGTPGSAAGQPEAGLDQLVSGLGLSGTSLRRAARACGVPYMLVPSLNHPKTIDFVARVAPDAVVYGGGGIVRGDLIAAARGMILNAHSGPLPAIRGMNALEWSLLLGEQPTVTVHLIDRGIDTGEQIAARPVPVADGDTIESLRSKCAAIGVELMVSTLDEPLRRSAAGRNARGRQCFILAPALHALLARRLASQHHGRHA